MTKTCNKCGEEKEYFNFYKHRNTSDGYMGCCKKCHKAYQKDYQEHNAEKNRAYQKAYRERKKFEPVEYYVDDWVDLV